MAAIKLSEARTGDRITSTNLHPVDRDFVYEFKIMGFDACFGKLETEERVKFELGEYAASLLPRINPHPARLLGRWRVSTGGTKAVSPVFFF